MAEFDSRSIDPQHLSANSNYEPQRTNNFQLEIPELGGYEDFMLAVQDFSAPNITNDPITVQHGNAEVHYAGQASYTGMDTLSVRDYIEADIERIVRDWHIKVFNPETGEIGWASEYKLNGELIEFGPNGEFVRTWKIKGMWPSGVNYGPTLSHEGGDVKQIDMTITYDKAFRVV